MVSQGFVSLGAMSGTSLDGLDVVAVSAQWPKPKEPQVRVLGHVFQAYPESLRRAFEQVFQTQELSDAAVLASVHAEFSSKVILKLCASLKLTPKHIDVLGVHGQTLFHAPTPKSHHGFSVGYTVQLGNPSLIAQRTGITTVGHFRQRDISEGGQGAPLVPLAHRLLFAKAGRSQVIQNLGGIGNLTHLMGQRLVSSFDTGPGNCWIDAVVKRRSKGRYAFDPSGRLARRGQARPDLVKALLRHPYFLKSPPKSTGWEAFSFESSLKPLWTRLSRLSLEDASATVSDATLAATVLAYERYVLTHGPLHRLILAGGGAKNLYLRDGFSQRLPNTIVLTSDDLGIPASQLESVAFALLAIYTLCGLPGSEPRATGARVPVICGEVAFGHHPEHQARIRPKLLQPL